MKVVADRHRHAVTITSTGNKIFSDVNINDLEWSWIPKKGVLVIFSQFQAAMHIKSELRRNGWRMEIDKDNLCTEFLALNVDISTPSSDPLHSTRHAHKGVKRVTCLKSGYFSAIGLFAWKQLQIGTDMLLTITSTGDMLLRGINIDEP